MTTEDDFQRALDANTDDWQTQWVFADWLDEHADPRAEGYRVLGTLRLWSDMSYSIRFVYRSSPDWTPAISADRSVLPQDWYEPLLRGELSLLANESRRVHGIAHDTTSPAKAHAAIT